MALPGLRKGEAHMIAACASRAAAAIAAGKKIYTWRLAKKKFILGVDFLRVTYYTMHHARRR